MAESSSPSSASLLAAGGTALGSPGAVVAITGANGALGRALLRRWHERGARLIALTTCEEPLALTDRAGGPLPVRQVCWRAGGEALLEPLLAEVDVLVINHGVNRLGRRSAAATEEALEVNALSAWRLLELFALVVARRPAAGGPQAGVWGYTSEAEIQPARGPLDEIRKRRVGEVLRLRALDLAASLRIRRLVLGPFRSALNPYGVMSADWVAGEILRQAGWNCSLILVTPNPLTYVLMPLAAVMRRAYYGLVSRPEPPGA